MTHRFNVGDIVCDLNGLERKITKLTMFGDDNKPGYLTTMGSISDENLKDCNSGGGQSAATYKSAATRSAVENAVANPERTNAREVANQENTKYYLLQQI